MNSSKPGLPGHSQDLSLEFGFSPPSRRGWVPLAKAKKGSWHRNPEKPDWLHESEEDVYFHIPSKSLWREESIDSRAAAGEDMVFRPGSVHIEPISVEIAAAAPESIQAMYHHDGKTASEACPPNRRI
eukprot:gnl/TRDRNA2_/TRDRNA2_94798_c0_seq1.p1 gnl/TRDRNA2_/TRDRNA2_94798_c0~~gnl/TRDRNA2_/TRDRNA2_94798_c0_seq1.p1  ORF type:complete len:128 (+),score=17.30 gnl/TRDRNA2_/TRDRNA2_94798_c0_seq1:406-789(+)